MTSGVAPARATSSVVTDPVVPHDTAASEISASPRTKWRGLDGLDTAANHTAQRRPGMNIGFIGTGTMGRPMLANLVKKGFAVVAYDVVPDALAGAVAAGARAAASPAEVARQSELVVTMLPSSSHVEAVYLGPAGVKEGVAAGRLCIDMSTIDPSVSRRVAAALAQQRVRFVDAPVSGGVPRATDGTLAIMVGGDARDVEEARPVLAALGANIIHVGAVGSGEVAKLCNNLIAGVAAVAVSEAFRIAEGFGVDAKVLTDVISKSSGHTWVMEHMHPVPGLVARSASSQEYAPGFMTDLMAKDLGLAVNAARELRVPVVVSPAAQQVLRLASSHGLGRKDFTAVYTFLKPSDERSPV
ncbi:MAG: 3-hydroxyisobutyrate dehydrogenase [Candidatus Rokuibacteriota bacterium]|nr:MAG: 3-hydroxyisobutyrate dehydrogenase [Candidatus Rokubacteria bacterium]